MHQAEKVNLLVVDDRPDKLLALEAILGELEQNLVTARSGREALRELLEQDFAAILLDVNMPGMDGFETAAMIRQRKRSEHTPIIFITAFSNTDTHVQQGYSLGAVDYIHAPVVPEVLRAKVNVFVDLFRKTEEIKRQADALREIEAREHERRLSEAYERIQSETRRNLFFVLSIDLLCIAGLDGFFKQLNPSWHKTLGYSDEELTSRPIIEFLHADDRPAAAEQMRKLSEGQSVTYFETRFQARDGSYRWLGWTATPFLAEGLIYMFARDVTQRKQSEEERAQLLERERERSTQLHRLNAASVAIHSAGSLGEMLQVLTDQARQVIGAHQGLTRFSLDQNWSRARTFVSLSQKMGRFNPSEDGAHGPDIFSLAIGMNRPLRLSRHELESHAAFRDFARNGCTLPQRGWLSAPLRGQDGRNMGILQVSDKYSADFSEEDEAVMAQIAQIGAIAIENALFSEAREANRLKDEFLATLSHELRTPLNAMLGWAQLLRAGKLDEATRQRAVEVIERNVKVQVQLIEDLLDVSRITTGKIRLNIQSVELAAALDAAIDVIAPAAQARGIELTFTREPVPGPIAADPDRLQQVLWNLLSNAVKFTPEGGRVSLALRYAEPYAAIEVSDTGKGIRADFLPYIFDRFRQSDSSSTRSHGGLGLGLAIVQHLVELHGGSVTVQSAGEGQGCTFTVRLPLGSTSAVPAPCTAERNAAAIAQECAAAPRPQLEGLQILVADDEPDARDLICTVLDEYGARVTAFASAAELLDAIEHAAPHLVISDIGMPGEDGYSLIRKLRARGDDVPAIALTAYAREEDRSRALALGFQDHVAKPIEPLQLAAVVARWARRTPEPQRSPAPAAAAAIANP